MSNVSILQTASIWSPAATRAEFIYTKAVMKYGDVGQLLKFISGNVKKKKLSQLAVKVDSFGDQM